MGARYELGQATHIGRRRSNQDRSGVAEEEGSVLLALADGMGGHPRGERAAETVVDTAIRLFRRARRPLRDQAGLLEQMLERAHDRVVAFGRSQRPPIEPRSTAALALIDGDRLYWAHLGDSRLYLFRAGALAMQTHDHSYVEKLRQQGLISARELEEHPFRNYVTRCIGGAATFPEASLGGPLELESGDVTVLCSDGFWSPLSAEEIGAALGEARTELGRILPALVGRAVSSARPYSDNATAVALRWLAPSPGRAALNAEDDVSRAVADLRRALDSFSEDDGRENP